MRYMSLTLPYETAVAVRIALEEVLAHGSIAGAETDKLLREAVQDIQKQED